MTSIIVYQPPLDGTEDEATLATNRRTGMLLAGDDLRSKLKGAQTDADVEAAVQKVVKNITKTAGITAYLETQYEAADGSIKPLSYKIDERKGGKFKLIKTDDPNDDKRKLKLDGAIDEGTDDDAAKKPRNYRMTTVSPQNPEDEHWSYLATTVFKDLLEIEGISHTITNNEEIENYLIATFAFTRCR